MTSPVDLDENKPLTAAVLPLVPQVVETNWWHAYGPLPAGGTYVHGPTTIPKATAATLGSIVQATYLGSFDHQPTQAELTKALG